MIESETRMGTNEPNGVAHWTKGTLDWLEPVYRVAAVRLLAKQTTDVHYHGITIRQTRRGVMHDILESKK